MSRSSLRGYALRVAWIEFNHFRAENPGPLWQSLRETKDPTLPTVLFEDAAALLGLIVALLGVTLALVTGSPMWDGAASVFIGVVLFFVALFLFKESYSLLIGEAASPRVRKKIREVVEGEEAVEELIELLTLQRGPRSLLIALDLRFHRGLSTDEIEKAVVRMEAAIRAQIKGARHIFIEAGSLRTRSPEEVDS